MDAQFAYDRDGPTEPVLHFWHAVSREGLLHEYTPCGVLEPRATERTGSAYDFTCQACHAQYRALLASGAVDADGRERWPFVGTLKR